MVTTAPDSSADPAGRLDTKPRGHLGWVVAGSLVAGLVLALVLVVVVFAGAREHVVTATAMLAFACGWAMLAVLSTVWTDQPQRWALLPAGYLALVGAGLLLAAPADGTLSAAGWVWPPVLLALVVWMTVQARRRLRSRTRAWLLYPVFGFLALAAVGGGYETVQETVDAAAHPMPGQSYDVGGYRLHLHCTGFGSPTVLLVGGLGERSSAWRWVAEAIGPDTRVCAYDRAGQGWSQDAPVSEDGLQVAADLHALLGRAQVDDPYVLAGHSIGGVYALDFAARYPIDVAGLVLVDSATPEQLTKLPGYAGFYSTWRRVSALFPSLARLGIGRLAFGSSFADLPAQARDEERAFASTARDLRSQRDELAELPAAFTQAQAVHDLRGAPLFVVTAAGEPQQAGWFTAQDDLATLSTDVVHLVAPEATHSSLLENPKDAATSSRAIRDVVSSVRTARPLSAR